MVTQPLLAVGLLLILGYLGGRLVSVFKLPRVSGYLIIGMLLSPSLFEIFPYALIDEELNVITEMALGVIAYSIGGSLVLERLKRIRKSLLCITVCQAGCAFLLTTGVLIPVLPIFTGLRGDEYTFLKTFLPMALLIGAISMATASGAILAIINELRAGGPFTTALLAVIAISYAVTVIVFTLALTVSHLLIHPATASCGAMLAETCSEMGLSLVLGSVAGGLLKLLSRMVRRREAQLMLILGTLFSSTGTATLLGLSPLLANMAQGFVVANFGRPHADFFLLIEAIEEPLFGLFFVLAGAHIDLSVLNSAGLLAVAIVLARALGKCFGVWVGARISRAPANIQHYLGLGLVPQAGWTVGLVLLARGVFTVSLVTNIMVNAIIGSVVISQLLGLPLVRYALVKAGETFDQRAAYGPEPNVGLGQ